MQPHPNLATLRPVLDQPAAYLFQRLRPSVTPIAAYQGEGTIQWGTGTLFQVGDASFLVTAAHVWDEAVEHNLTHLCVFDRTGPAEDGQRLVDVPLDARTILYRVRDPADVGVFDLSQKVVEQLRGRRFLRLNEVRLGPVMPGLGWVYGFPREIVDVDEANSMCQYNEFFLAAGFRRPGDFALDGFDERFHFLLDADRRELWSPSGTQAEMPDRLEGISGCCVWQTFDPNRARIVGVQTGYYRQSSVVKATRWAVVANIIWQRRPDLRKVLEMHFGPSSPAAPTLSPHRFAH